MPINYTCKLNVPWWNFTRILPSSGAGFIEIRLIEKRQKRKRSIQDNTELIEDCVSRKKSIVFWNKLEEFSLSAASAELNVSHMLSIMNLHPTIKALLSRRISRCAAITANWAVTNGFNTFGMLADVEVVIDELYDEAEYIYWIVSKLMNHTSESRAVVSMCFVQDLTETLEGDLEKESCAVCLESFMGEAKVARMPCKHVFHRGCLVRWFEKSFSCPLCRYQILNF